MFAHPPTYKNDFILKFNSLATAFKKAAINVKLKTLDPKGACNGLAFCYKLYAHQKQREMYVLVLKFIASLNETTTNELIERYKLAKSENKNFLISFEGHTINFDKIISILQNIISSQYNQTLKEIGITWDKTYSFICHQKHLKDHLNNAQLQNDDSAFISIGAHLFYIEKTKDGFYLFDANHIGREALLDNVISSTDELANAIIKNCSAFMGNNPLMAFSMHFVSYAYQSNFELDHAIKNALDSFSSEHELFLMSTNETGLFIPSDKSHLYLYKEADKIFFLKKINDKNSYEREYINIESVQELLNHANFNQPLIEPKKCEDIELQKVLFEIISKKGDLPFESNLLKIKSIINLYDQSKISRLDCALKLSELLNEMSNDREPVKNFKIAIQMYLDSEKINKFILNTSLEQDEESINMPVYSFDLSLLYLAVEANQLLLISQLINTNALANVKTNGRTPLYIASYDRNTEAVELLLSHKDIRPNLQCNNKTPLYIASQIGDTEVVELLLSHIAINPNLQCIGISPLYIASEKGLTRVVELLLSHKDTDINLLCNGISPIFIAVSNEHQNIVNLLISKNAKLDVGINVPIAAFLNQAKLFNKENELKNLLIIKNDGKLPDTVSAFTPLHAAILTGNEKIVASLLAAKADPEATSSGISCIELAEVMNRQSIISTLKIAKEASASPIVTPSIR